VRGNGATYQALPYDGQFLYDFRLANALSTRDLDKDDKDALMTLQRMIKGLANQKGHRDDPVGTPVPYAAILKADGDRMGKLLGQAKTAAASRRISKDLHGFASAVRGIVQHHRGHAIYSGGDDVLALLPLDGAVSCADSLRHAFAKAMAGSAQALDMPEKDWPTLSVGFGIGHVMEPLGSLRARADLAERLAKGGDLAPDRQRNALAIVLGIRSGADYPWRAQWDDLDAFAALDRFRRAYRDGELPSRVAYDLREIGRRLAWLDDHVKQGRTDAETAAGMRRSEVKRVLERARREGGARDIEKDLQALILTRTDTQTLDDLANTLIVARWLSARTATEVGDRP
jgi:CRISPR-associated protein Cmr2